MLQISRVPVPRFLHWFASLCNNFQGLLSSFSVSLLLSPPPFFSGVGYIRDYWNPHFVFTAFLVGFADLPAFLCGLWTDQILRLVSVLTMTTCKVFHWGHSPSTSPCPLLDSPCDFYSFLVSHFKLECIITYPVLSTWFSFAYISLICDCQFSDFPKSWVSWLSHY